MLKRLAILSLLALGFLTGEHIPFPVKGDDQQYHAREKKDASNPFPQAACGSSVCKENADNAERYAYYKAHPKEYWKAITAPVNAANWILAFFAVIGSILAWGTLIVIRRSSERQLRAYVLPESADISNVADPPLAIGPPRETAAKILYPEWGAVVMVQVKNMGQTPAFDVLHYSDLVFREFPLKTPLPLIPSNKGLIGAPLGPGICISKKKDHPPLTPEQLSSLRRGESSFYLYGVVTYMDIFKKRHFTRYRLLHNPGAGPIGVSTFFTFAEEGNEADDTQKKWGQRIFKKRQT
jgi:hypothetical protein